MSELTFYRQERHDQGVRSGVEHDGITLLSDYQEGTPELQLDPLGSALEWYVDVRCHGENLPTEPEDARRWLLEHRTPIEEGLRDFAESTAAGVDDSFPLRWCSNQVNPSGFQIEIVCSAIRRITAHRLGLILVDFACNFADYLSRLSLPETSLR